MHYLNILYITFDVLCSDCILDQQLYCYAANEISFINIHMNIHIHKNDICVYKFHLSMMGNTLLLLSSINQIYICSIGRTIFDLSIV